MPTAINLPADSAAPAVSAPASAPAPASVVYRHRLPVRLWHWLNAVAIIALFMSGLMIFNAHPRLYWGHYGANDDAAWLVIDDRGATGFVRLGSLELPTTGVLGLSRYSDGQLNRHAFPGLLTLPTRYDLAGARRYHLFFAWLFGLGFLGYFIWTVVSRHMTRDLGLQRRDLSPAHLWHEVKDHARLRFPTGAAAARFNTLQKLSYVGVLFVLIPMMVLTGITMSPGMDASWPWLVDLFGGRQSARSLHFIACWMLFGFFVVHILMVLLAGPINEVRSMITGWFTLPPDRAPAVIEPAEEAVAQ